MTNQHLYEVAETAIDEVATDESQSREDAVEALRDLAGHALTWADAIQVEIDRETNDREALTEDSE